jgi:hypothetical protein
VSGIFSRGAFSNPTRFDRTTVRALTTVYTNTTGKVVYVIGYCTFTVAGTLVATLAGLVNTTDAAAIGAKSFHFIVKPNETMQITITGTGTLTKWFEFY